MSNGSLNNNRFEIGGEDLLGTSASIDAEVNGETSEEREYRPSLLDDLRIRIGTLLKTETASLLLGAGASVNCGGELIGSVPLAIERALQSQGVSGTQRLQVRRWLLLFYLAVYHSGAGEASPTSRDQILRRREKLASGSPEQLPANLEHVLATLQRWRAAIPENGHRIRLDGPIRIDATSKNLETAFEQTAHALAHSCVLPAEGHESGHEAYKTLIRKLLTRPLNLKRLNVFTLNYDTLVEQAADAEGVVLLDGFVGTQHRTFRPESYEQDLYFPAETTEGRVHRFDRVLHLYKLHGSITWTRGHATLDNPYGVRSAPFDPDASEPLLIYPTPAKSGETLGLPYSELFRRFAAALVRPQSVLFVVGYGFGDEHVNAIIRQALAVPSFTLVIVDPNPENDFVQALRKQGDRRVWVLEGPSIGTLAGFSNYVLPDLRDEEIEKKVLATHRAIAENSSKQGVSADDERL